MTDTKKKNMTSLLTDNWTDNGDNTAKQPLKSKL